MKPRTTLSLLHWSRASREAAKFAESGLAELERRRSPITAPTSLRFRITAWFGCLFESRDERDPESAAVLAGFAFGGAGLVIGIAMIVRFI